MSKIEGLRVEITPTEDSDAAELADLTAQLRRRFLELDDVVGVDAPRGGPAPTGAKSVDAAVHGILLVSLAPAMLGAAVTVLQTWLARRPVRSVKITLGADTVELTGHSGEDQRSLVEAFVARHSG